MPAAANTFTVRIELPLATRNGVAPDPVVVGEELRLLWVIEQVRLGKVGVGKGAELAGVPRARFMQVLGAHGVPVIDYPPAELEQEIEHSGSM